ncbi:MAG TPA: hypothetical protein VK835_08275 [Bacteroidia bacterium]|nr:hypothetical protein [Bacteroidia bacterium]
MKNLLLIIGILVTLFSCKKSSTNNQVSHSNTSKVQVVLYSPVFPYTSYYSSPALRGFLVDTFTTRNFGIEYNVVNGQHKQYFATVVDDNNLNTTTADSFRVTVYINGAKKYYNAGKSTATVQIQL